MFEGQKYAKHKNIHATILRIWGGDKI